MYNKVEFAGKVSWIQFGTSQKGNSYLNGYIQCWQDGEYNGKQFKQNYVSIKFTAFNENAEQINAMGTKKDSYLKITGYLKGNKYTNPKTQEETNETILLVESVDSSYQGESETEEEFDNDFFNDMQNKRVAPSSTNKNDDLDDGSDDLPF